MWKKTALGNWLRWELSVLLVILLTALAGYVDRLGPVTGLHLDFLYIIPIIAAVHFFDLYGLLAVVICAVLRHNIHESYTGLNMNLVTGDAVMFSVFLAAGLVSLFLFRHIDKLQAVNRQFSGMLGFTKAVIDSEIASIIVTDLDGRIVEFGKTGEKFLGVKRAHWVGKTLQEMDLDPVLREELKHASDSPDELLNKTLELTIPGNIHVRWISVPVRDIVNNKIIGRAHAFLDITSQVEDHARLVRQTRMLSLRDARNRLATNLHDSLAQALATLNMRLGMAGRLLDESRDDAKSEIETCRDLLTITIKDLRRSILELRPVILERLDLVNALKEYVRQFSEMIDLPIKLDIDEGFGIEADRELLLFYFVQESLTNAFKHARANSMEVSLKNVSGGKWKISVKDDGCGFLADELLSPGLGVADMKDKASLLGGELVIKSKMDNMVGTELSILFNASETREDNNGGKK
ncbi:MAG: histidine kinase [Chloroflexi bacterium]|nr:histidine kinase [Chloroflexota bacterium]